MSFENSDLAENFPLFGHVIWLNDVPINKTGKHFETSYYHKRRLDGPVGPVGQAHNAVHRENRRLEHEYDDGAGYTKHSTTNITIRSTQQNTHLDSTFSTRQHDVIIFQPLTSKVVPEQDIENVAPGGARTKFGRPCVDDVIRTRTIKYVLSRTCASPVRDSFSSSETAVTAGGRP
ncbi:hypothetical protein SISNIDRAFT_495990 [Sistotremastrum niveocremeum HHB9708]|uniref:Uncharacterized protein n=1 Tax=Sistotremastrum niveocremeum HHB9708 TaxID=1314777 RepID=A0A164U233_9AGAM|nr:hypothetical protein SISNIDRAFT_495990 [Sistotremastrum niveocremeum HHB9708]